LLRAEGFTDIRYVETASTDDYWQTMAAGKVDFSLGYASEYLTQIDAGALITLLAGVMVGCYELFASEGIHSIAELRGKSVGRQALGSQSAVLLTLMTAQLLPRMSIGSPPIPPPSRSSYSSTARLMHFSAFRPSRRNSVPATSAACSSTPPLTGPDRSIFCCMLAGSSAFVREHPVAIKRVLRAILKAADLCATDPARAAQLLVDGGFTPRYDYALQTLTDNG
jgi:NitT/TauT family transport system substrate-binding protein